MLRVRAGGFCSRLRNPCLLADAASWRIFSLVTHMQTDLRSCDGFSRDEGNGPWGDWIELLRVYTAFPSLIGQQSCFRGQLTAYHQTSAGTGWGRPDLKVEVFLASALYVAHTLGHSSRPKGSIGDQALLMGASIARSTPSPRPSWRRYEVHVCHFWAATAPLGDATLVASTWILCSSQHHLPVSKVRLLPTPSAPSEPWR
jgi:hypothetical protein